MSKSILIEVDEMTRGIMQTVQSEMYEGSRSAFEHMKDDMVATVETVQKTLKQMELTLQRRSKDSEGQSEQIMREIGQMQQSVAGIPLSLRSELDAMSKVLLQQVTQLEGRHEHITTALDGIQEQTKQVSHMMAVLDTIHEQTKQLSNLTTVLEAIQEQSKQQLHVMARLDAIHEQVTQHSHMTAMLEVMEEQSKQQSMTQELLLVKLQKLEQEVEWSNTPLLKKWFGGRKKTT